jgi:hypothetical protein
VSSSTVSAIRVDVTLTDDRRILIEGSGGPVNAFNEPQSFLNSLTSMIIPQSSRGLPRKSFYDRNISGTTRFADMAKEVERYQAFVILRLCREDGGTRCLGMIPLVWSIDGTPCAIQAT